MAKKSLKKSKKLEATKPLLRPEIPLAPRTGRFKYCGLPQGCRLPSYRTFTRASKRGAPTED